MFPGFELPQENWSKLPHSLIEALDQIETLGELKVILYVLRHTWGFQEFDEGKRITMDEFANGRKRRDGSRLDAGTGLSGPTISNGIQRAVEHGFLTVEVDDSDKGRIKKYYALRMENPLTPGVKKVYPRPKESLHRSEKDTQGKIPIEIIESEAKARRKVKSVPLRSQNQNGHLEMVAALVSAYRWDPELMTGEQDNRMHRLSKKVRGAGYSVEEVREAARLWWDGWPGNLGQSPGKDAYFLEKLGYVRKAREEHERRWGNG